MALRKVIYNFLYEKKNKKIKQNFEKNFKINFIFSG